MRIKVDISLNVRYIVWLWAMETEATTIKKGNKFRELKFAL